MTRSQKTAVNKAARLVSDLIEAGDWAGALAAINAGEENFPGAALPGEVTWDALRGTVQARLAEQQAAQPPAPVQVQDQAAPESAPTKALLRIVHTVDNGTIITGIKKSDGTRDYIGAKGQRWSWHRTENYRYLGNSAGWAADMERIELGAQALRLGGWTVEIDVDNHNYETGQPAPVKPQSDYRRQRLASCRSHISELTTMPAPPAPKAAPVQAPVSAPPAPVAAPKVERAPRAVVSDATIAEIRALEEADRQAAQAPVRPLETVPVEALAMMIGSTSADVAAAALAEMVHRVSSAGVAPVSAPPAPQVEQAAAPEAEQAPESDDDNGPIELTVALKEDAKDRKTASDVRVRLHEHFKVSVSFRNLTEDVRVWLDKDARTIKATVVLKENASQYKREQAAKKLRNVVLAQRGVEGVVEAAREFAAA